MMSLHLRVNTSQGRSPTFKGKSRVLLRSSDPPESPVVQGNACDAIESDGTRCRLALPTDSHAWCKRHVRELKDLSNRWGRAQKDAERVDAANPDTAKQKVLKLRLAVELRRQIHERFYPRGGDTPDFLRWIMKLEKDIRGLADSILSKSIVCVYLRKLSS